MNPFNSGGHCIDKSVLAFLVLFAVVLTSGCISADARLDMRPLDDRELADLTSEDYSNLDVELKKVFNENNSLSTAYLPYDIRDYGEPVMYHGSYFKIHRELAGEVKRVSVRFLGEEVNSSRSTDLNLSEKDERLVNQSIGHARAEGFDMPKSVFGVEYTPEEFERSSLKKREKLYVQRENTTLLLERQEVENVTRELYNYSTRKVANSTQQWTETVKERYVSTPHESNHSSELLRNATEGYYGEETEEFKNTVEVLKKKPAYRMTDNSGTWIVNYSDQIYWLEASWTDLEN